MAEIATYTYKQGVSLSVIKTGSDVVMGNMPPVDALGYMWSLVIVAEAVDTQQSGTSLPVRSQVPIPDWIDNVDTFANFIRLCVIFWETHEADEWIKRNNERVFTPSHHGESALSTMQTDIYARLNRLLSAETRIA